MKKSFIIVFALLLTLAVATSSCQLPAPGKLLPTATTSAAGDVSPTEAQEKPAGEKPTDASASPTETPMAVTATSVPSTATTAPEAATPTPAATRIQFASGATSATVSGELANGGTAPYVLQASAGQTMSVEVWSPNGDVYLAVSGASDGQTLLEASANTTEWSGKLPATQDYYLTLLAGNGQTSYSITVTIPPLEATAQPTSAATATPVPSGAQFDPYKTYGKPDYENTLDKNSVLEWAEQDGELPDTENIRLSLDGNKFLVTGKYSAFSTWWFNWRSLEDFYIELAVNTRTCAGDDAYGLILRGPEHGAGKSYGYVVAFTCDGKLWVYRLDSASPFTSLDLVSPTAYTSIVAGADQRNVIGVKADGDTLTIYANGYQVAQVVDRHFGDGRFGLFVRPMKTDYYTFEALKIVYWVLE